MVGLQSACRYKLEFPSRRKVKMLVDGGECAMKNGEPITKSILIADLPAGDKPSSCRPTMPAVCRPFQVSSMCCRWHQTNLMALPRGACREL